MRTFCFDRLGEARDIGAADVTFVGTRMDGDAARAGLDGEAGERGDIRHAGVSRIAQQRNLVEIDAEAGHQPFTTATASISIMKSGPARRVTPTVVLVGVAIPR